MSAARHLYGILFWILSIAGMTRHAISVEKGRRSAPLYPLRLFSYADGMHTGIPQRLA